jgi:hypothetical protein
VQQAVRKRRLAVVNVGNNAEISYVCGIHQFFLVVILIAIAGPYKTAIRAQQDNWKAVEEKEI